MFDQIKQANKLRKVQGDMKKQMEGIFIAGEKSGMKVVIRGDKKIERILIDGVEDKELKDLINDTLKDLDKRLEKQLRGQMSDLGIPGLS